MNINPTAQSIHTEVTEWRHHIHKNPELSMEEYKTSAFVKEKLTEMGVEFQEFAGTGVVATLRSGTGNRAIGFRCELDALPMPESNTFDHKSQTPGVMHACGHDGHTAMLLGAVKAMKQTADFDGIVHFIFQPGEEGSGGAEIMMQDGLFEKCPMEEIYAMHNWPGIDVGQAGVISGPVMAATDCFFVTVTGKGGHAAMPHVSADPVPATVQIISALQTLVSRNVNPVDKAVLSVTTINGGTATNIIPDVMEFSGTVRTFKPETRTLMENRIAELVSAMAQSLGVTANVVYERGYPATSNDETATQNALSGISEVVGDDNVLTNLEPCMGGEDFSYMLEKVPGHYLWLGNGNSKDLHNVGFDFNDEIIPIGVSYWMEMAKQRLPKKD